MVYGSNESVYYPDEGLNLNSRTGTPLQKSFEKVDVLVGALVWQFKPEIRLSKKHFLISNIGNKP